MKRKANPQKADRENPACHTQPSVRFLRVKAWKLKESRELRKEHLTGEPPSHLLRGSEPRHKTVESGATPDLIVGYKQVPPVFFAAAGAC